MLRASLNSFGYGGTNAHVILEEAESYLEKRHLSGNKITNGVENGLVEKLSNGFATTNGFATPKINGIPLVSLNSQNRVFVLSSFSKATSKSQAQNLLAYVDGEHRSFDEDFLENLAFTLNSRRSRFTWRLAVSAPSRHELKKAVLSRELDFSQALTTVPRLGFVFTGQGAQWFAMGRELFNRYPVYRESILKADGQLKKLGAEWSLFG